MESSEKRLTKRLIDEVRQMVAEHSGTEIEKVNERSCLQDDIGMEGEDAEEFMLAYAEKFSVDLSNFWIPDYFLHEYQIMNPLSFLSRLIGGDHPKKPLTIMMLAEAAAMGRWPARDTNDVAT